VPHKFKSFHLSRVPKVGDHPEKVGEKKIQLWEFPKVSAHHHPLDACYYSVVDEPQLS